MIARASAPSVEEDAVEAARAFYCDVLGGRQLRSPACAGAAGVLLFLVDGTILRTGPGVPHNMSRVPLRVEDPDLLATRCWNAGFTVRANQDAYGLPTLTLVDPFGLHIDLVQR